MTEECVPPEKACEAGLEDLCVATRRYSSLLGNEETGFLSVAVITTRFTDEQCLPSSLATRERI